MVSQHKDDKDVEVLILKCPKCNKVHLVQVKHTMTAKDEKMAGKLVAKGCVSELISLLSYRDKQPMEWCFTLCKQN